MRANHDQSAVSEALQEVTGLVPPQLTLVLWIAQLLVAVLVACAIIKRPSARPPPPGPPPPVPAPPPPPPQHVPPPLVRRAAALPDRLAAAGARIGKPLRDAPYGLRDFIFADPDGNRNDVGQKR